MAQDDPHGARVAVYLDFDNLVISRYDELHGKGTYLREQPKGGTPEGEAAAKLREAEVQVGAILDYASSFGTVVGSRAYADWSNPVNAAYQRQLVDRAVDLTQLFSTSGTKNGADIRLAIDAVEDVFRLSDVTHILVAAGDSDYIPLVQRAKRLGRVVIGVGVKDSTSRALVAACDHFTYYHQLPGVRTPAKSSSGNGGGSRRGKRGSSEPAEATSDETPTTTSDLEPDQVDSEASDAEAAATELLRRALELLDASDSEEWMLAGELKNQMMRLDPSFKEKPLGYRSFSAFVEAHDEVVEVKPKSNPNSRRFRLRG